MEIANTPTMGTSMGSGPLQGFNKHKCNDVNLVKCSNKESLDVKSVQGQAGVEKESVVRDKSQSSNCSVQKYGVNDHQDILPNFHPSAENERIAQNGLNVGIKPKCTYRNVNESQDCHIWADLALSCKKSPENSSEQTIETKLMNGNSLDKFVRRDRQQSNGFRKHNKHFTNNKQSWKYHPIKIENKACSLFEKQLQELESQTAEKCLKLKFGRKKIKSSKIKTSSEDKKQRHFCSVDTSSKKSRIEQNRLKDREHNRKSIKCDKHFHNDGSNESKKIHKRTLSKWRRQKIPLDKSIDSEKNQQHISRDEIKHFLIRPEETNIVKTGSEGITKDIPIQNRCYRLQSPQWKGSSKCVLRLLKRKYNSVRTLFSKNPVLSLHKLDATKVKMIGDNFEVISMWETETDSSVYQGEEETDKEVSSDGVNLVDPRVMSLSRTLESGHNGKVGAEKTFKNLSGKSSCSKTQVCFKLEAIKSAKKPVLQKPEWLKLKHKLKEVNEKKILQKKKDGINIGKDVSRIPELTRNPSVGYRDSAKQNELESKESKSTESSESSIQERKKELEKLCSSRELDESVKFVKDNNEELTSSNTLEEFQEVPSDLESNGDSNYKIGEYTIEICRDSGDEGNSMEVEEENVICKEEENQSEQTKDKETSVHDSNETRLTVTSGIIPNLYISESQPAPNLDEQSRSPPILIKEMEDENDARLDQTIFHIKETSSRETTSVDNEIGCLSRKDDVQKTDDNEMVEVNCEFSSCSISKPSSGDIEEKENSTLQMHIQHVCTTKDVKSMNTKEATLSRVICDDSPSRNIHIISAKTPEKEFQKGSSPELNENSSKLSSITDAFLSDSGETLIYPELKDEPVNTADKDQVKEDIESVATKVRAEYGNSNDGEGGITMKPNDSDEEQVDVGSERVTTEALLDKDGDDNVMLQRSLSSSSLSSDSSSITADQPDTCTFHTQTIFSNNPQGSLQYDMPGNIDRDNRSSVCPESKQLYSEQARFCLDDTSKATVFLVKLDIHSGEMTPSIKINEDFEKEKMVKSNNKRKKSLDRTFFLENDAEDLPKISPPKRRHRALMSTSLASAEDLNQARLMQDFPKHNWLFNKYSLVSSEANTTTNHKGAGDTRKGNDTAASSPKRNVSGNKEEVFKKMDHTELRPVMDTRSTYSMESMAGQPTSQISHPLTSTKTAASAFSSKFVASSLGTRIVSSPSLASPWRSSSPSVTSPWRSSSPSVALSTDSRNVLSLPVVPLRESTKVVSASQTKVTLTKTSTPSVSLLTGINETLSNPLNNPNLSISSLSLQRNTDSSNNSKNNTFHRSILGQGSSTMTGSLHDDSGDQLVSKPSLSGSLPTDIHVGASDVCKEMKIDPFSPNDKNDVMDVNDTGHVTQDCSSIKDSDLVTQPITDQSVPSALQTNQSSTIHGDESVSPNCNKTNNHSDTMKTGVDSLEKNSGELVNISNATNNRDQSQDAMEATSDLLCRTGSTQGLVGNSASDRLNLTTMEQTTNKTGNETHSCQEVDSMVEDKVASNGIRLVEMEGTSKLLSKETGTTKIEVSERPSNDTEVPTDSQESSSQCVKMIPSQNNSGSQSTVESSAMSFRQKPNPPVLRVQPHLYKPPGNSKNPSPEPQTVSLGLESSQQETIASISTAKNEVNSSTVQTPSMSVGDSRSPAKLPPFTIAQTKHKTTITLISDIPKDRHLRTASCNPRKSKTAEIVSIPLLPLSILSTNRSSNMVHPVHPIIQSLGSMSHPTNVQLTTSNFSSVKLISIHNRPVTSQANAGASNLGRDRKTLHRRSIPPFNPTTQVSPSYLYQQSPANLQVQATPINQTRLFEINPIRPITQYPQANQLFVLDSGRSVIPMSTVPTCVASSQVQHGFRTQDQLHVGQLLSSGRIIIAQPVGGSTGTTDSSATLVGNDPDVGRTVHRVSNKLEHVEALRNRTVNSVVTSSGVSDTIASLDRTASDIKKDPETPMNESVVLSDEEDEEFKRQMEEIDIEIQRKEKEREEMRKKKLELLQKRKETKFLTKIKTEETPAAENACGELTDGNHSASKIGKAEPNVSKMVPESKPAPELKDDNSTGSVNEGKDNVQNIETSCADNVTDDQILNTDIDKVHALKESEGKNNEKECERPKEEDIDEEEDAFEGALVIDLSASSKDRDSSAQSTDLQNRSCTMLDVQKEIKDKSRSNKSENKNEEMNIGKDITINEMSKGLLQELEPQVNNHSIEYIPDIQRINPFTGEYDQLENPSDNNESLDLSNKPRIKAVGPDPNETSKLNESTKQSPLPIKEPLEDKRSGNDDHEFPDDENCSDKKQDCKSREDRAEPCDTDTLDLSAKPLCVFTFKETSTDNENPATSKPRNIIEKPHEIKESDIKVNDHRSNLIPIDTNSKDISTCISTSIEDSRSHHNDGIESANVAIGLSTQEPMDAQDYSIDTNSMIENNTEKDRNTSIPKLKPINENQKTDQVNDDGNTRLNVPTTSSLEMKEATKPTSNELQPLTSNENLTIMSDAVKLETLSTTIVTQTSNVQISDGGNKSNTTSVTQSQSDTSSMQLSSDNSRTLPPMKTVYNPRHGFPAIDNQRSFQHTEHHHSPQSTSQHDQVVLPTTPEGMTSNQAVTSPSFLGQDKASRDQQVKRSADFQLQDLTLNLTQRNDSNAQRIDLHRGRSNLNRYNPPQRQARGMYIEMEPAHCRPPPKKIPKGAKPMAAHCCKINMQEIFKKMNMSHCAIPLQIQQSGPYFRRRQPVYCPAEDLEGMKPKGYTNVERPKHAHCQRPFSIAGQLIVSRKRKRFKEFKSPSPARVCSAPNTPPSPMKEVERCFSAKPDIPLDHDESVMSIQHYGQRSDKEDLTSPFRAHANLGNFSGNNANNSISTVQVLRPPSSYNSEIHDDRLNLNTEIIDLTQVASTKAKYNDPAIPGPTRHVNEESALQNELGAAVSAKRRRLDSHARDVVYSQVSQRNFPGTNSPNNQVGYDNQIPQTTHAQPYRMQAPSNKTMRPRQHNYNKPPRQVLSAVPVQKPFPTNTSVPYPLVQQALFADQGNPAPVRTHPLQEQPPGYHVNQDQGHQRSLQSYSRRSHHIIPTGEPPSQQDIGYTKHSVTMDTVGRPSPRNSMEMMNYPNHPSTAGMYPPRAESPQRRHNRGPADMPGHIQRHLDRLQHPIMSSVSKSMGTGPSGPIPHLLQQCNQAQMMSPGNQMVSPSNQMMSSNSPMSPSNQMPSPRNQMMSYDSNTNHFPSSVTKSSLPPGPRGDMQQNWTQMQKMQQVRAHHLRSIQNRQQTSPIGPRPSFPDPGHAGMADNFNQSQAQAQRYQLSSKSHQMTSPPYKTAQLQGINHGNPANMYPGPPFHGHQMVHSENPLSAAQMAQKHQQLGPPASNTFYIHPSEAQFVSHHSRFPPSLTQVQGHNRVLNSDLNLAQGHGRGNSGLIHIKGQGHNNSNPPQSLVQSQEFNRGNSALHPSQGQNQGRGNTQQNLTRVQDRGYLPQAQNLAQGPNRSNMTPNLTYVQNRGNPRQNSAHLQNRTNSGLHNQQSQTYQHHPSVFSPGFHSQGLPAHPVRSPSQQSMQGPSSEQHRPHPRTAFYTNSGDLRQQGYTKMEDGSLNQSLKQRQRTENQATEAKRKVQELDEEDMPHLQQVNGSCILCNKYSLYLCSSCKKIWYCSPECQLKHWQTHVNECKGPTG